MNGWLERLCDNDRIIVGTTRRGFSGGPYSGFNVCPYTGDSEEKVRRCREMLAAELEINPDRIVMPRQTHTANVRYVDGPVDIEQLQDIDALVTDVEELVIGVNTADCVPVVLADEEAGVIGVAHSGWRGTVEDIAGKTIREMEARGAKVVRMHAWIGPCIHQCCFETGEDVAAQFAERYVSRDGVKPHVDLVAAVRDQLEATGILSDRIVSHPGCTRCHPDTYWSARHEGIHSGRAFTFAQLKVSF